MGASCLATPGYAPLPGQYFVRWASKVLSLLVQQFIPLVMVGKLFLMAEISIASIFNPSL